MASLDKSARALDSGRLPPIGTEELQDLTRRWEQLERAATALTLSASPEVKTLADAVSGALQTFWVLFYGYDVGAFADKKWMEMFQEFKSAYDKIPSIDAFQRRMKSELGS